MSSTDISPRVLQLKDFPELDQEIPWNCIQRRNIAILTAFQKGCDVIITIGVSLPASFSPARFQYLTRACPDDDNYFVEGQDFVGEHCSPIVEGGSPHTELLSNTKVSLAQRMRLPGGQAQGRITIAVSGTDIGAAYAMSGTNIGASYTMSGTDVGAAYAMFRTDIGV
eukprot:1034879-Rhodomonas_salina.1